MEALNLRSVHGSRNNWNVGMVELQPKTHKRFMQHMKNGETSFNIAPITIVKEVIEAYEPDMVILDDKTNIPGLIEVITHDLKLPVILDSEKDQKIVKFPAVH